ncbi:MAG: glycosyltransferase family 2 protein, partial [Rubrobacter sp.]
MDPIAVVIPAKDEAATIGELLDRISHVPGYDLRPVVVDDGSTDGTAWIADERGALVVSHPANRGLGAAVRTGLGAAVDEGASVVAYLDADLEYFPEDLPRLLEPILAGRADYVLG